MYRGAFGTAVRKPGGSPVFAMLRGMVYLLWLVLFVRHSSAQDVTTVYLPPSKPAVAGQWCRLRLCSINDSAARITYTFQTNLLGTLTCGPNTVIATLYLNSHRGEIQTKIRPGDIAEAEYAFWIPTNYEGTVVLTVSNCNPVTLAVRRRSSSLLSASPQPPFETVSEQLSDVLGLNHFSTYEPIYFILGNPTAEFQFSLKYQLFSFESPNILTRFLDHTYIAYTQTSFWVLLVPDPYFYDTSYKPSAFFYATIWRKPHYRIDLQGGTEHESNGRGGSDERSIFTYYLQPTATVYLPAGFQLMLQPRARNYYLVNNNNANIAQYRGYADLYGALTWIQPNTGDKGEKIQFATRFRIGDEGNHTGLWFIVRFNLGVFPALRGVNPTIQLQYFTGYGQTLIQYNQKSTAFRAGISLWYY